MKFVSFLNPEGKMRSGWMIPEGVVDMALVSQNRLPDNMISFLNDHEIYLEIIKNDYAHVHATYSPEEIRLQAPLPRPMAFRNFIGFKEHQEHLWANEKANPVDAYYQIPVFYFGNRMTIYGPSDPVIFPAKSVCRDYEFAIGCIIGKGGRNINIDEADNHIFGYTILCSWAARDIQRKEQIIGLGPAKGKDFFTTIGPCIVTKDELEKYKCGNGLYNLAMVAGRNGKTVTTGNFKDIYYTFPAMIERASADVTIFPGELIGSGAVGNGCILEMAGDQTDIPWIESGENFDFEIEGIGTLSVAIV